MDDMAEMLGMPFDGVVEKLARVVMCTPVWVAQKLRDLRPVMLV